MLAKYCTATLTLIFFDNLLFSVTCQYSVLYALLCKLCSLLIVPVHLKGVIQPSHVPYSYPSQDYPKSPSMLSARQQPFWWRVTVTLCH